jgi:hypothetical protein
VSAHHRDLRLQSRPTVVDRARAQRRKPEAAALVEAQRVDAVVRRDQPRASAARRAGDPLDLGDQRGTEAVRLPVRVERQNLAVRAPDHASEHPVSSSTMSAA